MKNLKVLSVCVLFAFPLRGWAQEDLIEYLPAGETDAKFLMNEYLSIMAAVAESGLNSGWYTTGDPHYKFGFELNAALNTIFIPSKEDFYTVTSSDLSNASVVRRETDGTYTIINNAEVPTGYGPEDATPIFQITNPADPNAGAIFKGPSGNDLSDEFLIDAVIVPSLQLGIGIPYNMDIKIRYTPQYDYGDVKFGNWGVGLMHSIRQHIPALKVLPFGWSLFIAYSRLNGEIDFSGQWSGNNQVGEFHSNTWTFQTIASKDFSIFTVYGGIGYNVGNTEFDIKGTYNIVDVNPGDGVRVPLATPIIADLTSNPYHFAYDSQSLRMTLGLRMKFGPLIFFGDYTLQRTSVLSFGMGFTFKEDEF
jgi:hypothetical protein